MPSEHFYIGMWVKLWKKVNSWMYMSILLLLIKFLRKSVKMLHMDRKNKKKSTRVALEKTVHFIQEYRTKNKNEKGMISNQKHSLITPINPAILETFKVSQQDGTRHLSFVDLHCGFCTESVVRESFIPLYDEVISLCLDLGELDASTAIVEDLETSGITVPDESLDRVIQARQTTHTNVNGVRIYNNDSEFLSYHICLTYYCSWAYSERYLAAKLDQKSFDTIPGVRIYNNDSEFLSYHICLTYYCSWAYSERYLAAKLDQKSFDTIPGRLQNETLSGQRIYSKNKTSARPSATYFGDTLTGGVKFEDNMNNGLGPVLNNDEGVFTANGWIKQYECLTNESSLASAIFVPFYAGLDATRYNWGYNISLQKRDEWKYMNGKDHFLVGGRTTWEFRRSTDEDYDYGNKLLLLPAVKNMSILFIESSPWNSNEFAVPYPSYFHPSKDVEVFHWQDRMRTMQRKWLFCFGGSPRPGIPKSIRSLLIDQCKNSGVAKLLDCGIVAKKCHSPSSIMKMFQSSVFCLQPPGDSFTRRSAFDSILAGCILVFFHPNSFYAQYTWYLPKNYTTYSVFIAEDDIRKNVSIEQRLSQIDPQKINMMREEVINLIPRLIYADPRSKLETLKDAFDVSLEAIINKLTRLRQDMIDGHVNDDFIEELRWKLALLKEGE
ncbi:exostosin family protein [Artemisia annua]|uniref:Exostosin family protein n=1 Tax=Artemisia annua TaxID=35608 RepID=A0A2U1Q316_ARTAN|nr:exostosin family protein [Artemisia annua]